MPVVQAAEEDAGVCAISMMSEFELMSRAAAGFVVPIPIAFVPPLEIATGSDTDTVVPLSLIEEFPKAEELVARGNAFAVSPLKAPEAVAQLVLPVPSVWRN